MSDNTPASLFDQYDEDLQGTLGSIRDKLENARSQQGEQRKATLRQVDMEVDEADDILSQLDLEIQGIPQSIKPQYAPRLKQSRAALSTYKKLSKDLHSGAARNELLGSQGDAFKSYGDDPYSVGGDDRARLLAGHASLEDGSRRLQNSASVALDTEAQGAEILTNLRVQREQIENARDMLYTTDSNLDRAGGTLKKMIRQMYKQRFIYIGLGIVLVIVIILVLYFKLRR